MPDLGRTLIFLGLLLVVVGVVVLGFNRLNLPLGRLPGDFTWRGTVDVASIRIWLRHPVP